MCIAGYACVNEKLNNQGLSFNKHSRPYFREATGEAGLIHLDAFFGYGAFDELFEINFDDHFLSDYEVAMQRFDNLDAFLNSKSDHSEVL